MAASRTVGLSRAELATAALAVALTVAAGIAHAVGANDVLTFTVAGAALASLAWLVSMSTEAVGTHFGPGIWSHNVQEVWKAENNDASNPKYLVVYRLLNEKEAMMPHAAPANPFTRWAPKDEN